MHCSSNLAPIPSLLAEERKHQNGVHAGRFIPFRIRMHLVGTLNGKRIPDRDTQPLKNLNLLDFGILGFLKRAPSGQLAATQDMKHQKQNADKLSF